MRPSPPDAVLAEQPSRRLPGQPQLLQIRSDRRLGHEWDDWNGEALPNGGVFHETTSVFFVLAVVAGAGATLVVLGLVWLIGPRLATLAAPIPGLVAWGAVAAALLYGAWLGALALALRTGRHWLPEPLAERGLLPWLLPRIERLGVRLGLSRDRVGNSALRVFNALCAARRRPGVRPEDLLVLLPRCLGKEAMQGAMEISGRYGVPLFVASRGRYARQMIALRRPKRVVAVACERDLVSGVGDVAGRMPVLGTTLALPDGPCKNTEPDLQVLEQQIQTFLGLPCVSTPGTAG